MEQGIASLQSILPDRLGNSEDIKSDMHGTTEDRNRTGSPEGIGSVERAERELGEGERYFII